MKKTHGESRTRLYQIWRLILRRVDNTHLKKQGGDHRYDGINICDEWLDYEKFRDWSLDNGYTEKLSIDRRDGTKDYTPDNCRWSDDFTQAQNKGLSVVNKSGYRGIFFDKNRKRWTSTLEANKTTWRRRFKTLGEAIQARNDKIVELGTDHPIQEMRREDES